MEFGGMGGGDGRWGMKDSANSFVQYHLANEKSDGGGHSGGKNPIAQLIKAIFFISLVIGLYTFTASDMDIGAAIFLALAVSTVLALLPVGAIWLWLHHQARKQKSSENKTV